MTDVIFRCSNLKYKCDFLISRERFGCLENEEVRHNLLKLKILEYPRNTTRTCCLKHTLFICNM